MRGRSTAVLAALLALGLAAPAGAAAPAPGPAPGPGTPVPTSPDDDDTSAPVPSTSTKPPSKPGAALPKSPTPRTPGAVDRPAIDRAAADALDADDDGASGGSRSRSAFAVPVARRHDPYGPRPDGVAKLTLDQISRYALENPAVEAAQANVEAMGARVRKAKFAWVPTIDTSLSLAPGVFIECDDFVVPTVGADPVEFQYCRPGGNSNLDVQTVAGYFSQLAKAGVRFEFKLDAVIPLYTFGKFKNTHKAAKAAHALTKLQKVATQQETLLRVQQAHTTLLLARQSMAILREANGIVEKARKRVTKDLGGDPEDFEADPDDVNPDRDPDDLLKVDLAGLEIEELMREALKVESLALSALWALAGKRAPPGFDVADTQLAAIELDGGMKSLSHYKELAATARPEARMASAGVQVRKAQERLARSNFLPDLGITLNVAIARTNAADPQMDTLYYQDAFNYSRVIAALALRWRFDFHFDAFDLQAARAEVRAAEHQRAAALLLLGRDVEEAYADLVDAHETIDVRDRARKRSWQLVVSQEQKDTVGGGNSSELLRALEKWYKLRFSHVQAVAEHNVAAARLARAVGTPLWGASAPATAPASRVTPTTDSGRARRRDKRRAPASP